MDIISVDHLSHFDERPEHAHIDFGTRVDRSRLFSWLEERKPSLKAIVHIGACTDTTQMDERYLTKMNFDYSTLIWLYASQNSIPLVYASSAATYGAGEWGYDDNEDLIPKLKPLNPYGWSKQRFDLWALDQEKKGVHPPTWSGFKFFNVYGFGERHKQDMASVVLKAYDQILKSGSVRLFKSHKEGIADGDQKRDFVYVEDVVNVLQFALERPIERGIYNLGTGKARSFLDLVRAVFRAIDQEESIHFMDTPLALRNQYQYFTEAIMEQLGSQGYTKPFASLEEGVLQYVQALRRKS